MILDLPATLAVLAVALTVFGYAAWRASRPPNPMKVRMINWHVVQIFVIIVVLLMAAHLVTLITGHSLNGTAAP